MGGASHGAPPASPLLLLLGQHMTEASGKRAVLDVFRGKTYGQLTDDVLDQDGASSTASEADLRRIEGWILEGITQILPQLGESASAERASTLAVVAGTERYYLDYDVGQPKRVLGSDRRPITCMRQAESVERLDAGGGSWPDGTTMVLEETDRNGRWVVRIEPTPEESATYIIWHVPNIPGKTDRDAWIPLPAIFHPALEEYVFSKLFRRQEDSRMRMDALQAYGALLDQARAHFLPMENVSKGFRSTYDNRPTWRRSPGRHSP